jgi:D-inositol-3-phosphate glycosyltransferase
MSIRRVLMISFHTCPLASQEGKETGGMNVYVLELAKQLARQGIEVDVFTRSQDQEQPHIVQVDERFRVIHTVAGPEAPAPKKQLIEYLPEFVSNVRAFIEERGLAYDVMHCHYYLSGLAGLNLMHASGTRLPIIMTFHTLALMKNLVARDELEKEEKARIDAEYHLVQCSDRIIATSESDRDYLQYLYGAGEGKVDAVPPGVDLALFRPIDQAEARKKLDIEIEPGGHLILFCGRIEPLKGIDALLYAMKIMVEQQPELDVCLWIIGGDVSQPTASWSKELQKLERLRHTLNLSSVVHFAGQQLQEVLPFYYNAADVVVMPSHYESFGMAAAEAMACGVPIITTNVAGISSLIDEEQDLLLTSVNNPLLLAQQMKSLLIDPDKRAQVSEGLREKVSGLDWANIAERIISIYEDAKHAAGQR